MLTDTRAVSSVLGVALLMGMIVAGSVVVVTVGGVALDETRGGLDTSRAEKAMTQFDSRSAMVALGGTSHQGIDLATRGEDGYGVDPDVGWMNVTLYNQSADDYTPIVNETLGALVYENGGESIAYQGGGVWQVTDAGTRMLSSPEFHFRDSTLTLPIITVDGDAAIGGGAAVTRGESTTVRYPNTSSDASFTNPLDSGHVNVTVNSEYYESWGRYFEQRTDGNVSYDHERETARVKLVVPFNEEFDNVMAQTDSSEIRIHPHDPPERSATGINYPVVDDRIENRIDECQSESPSCETLPGGGADDVTIDSEGTYYADRYFSGAVTVDNPGGDVTVVVNENFSPSDVTIDSDHNTTFLVRMGVTLSKQNSINIDGAAGDLSVVVHSDGAINGNGNYEFVGLLYAPGSDCNFNGGGRIDHNLVGGVICEMITVNGRPNNFDYDPTIESTDLNLTGDNTPITFLHVTVNPVNVTSG